jgi:hypothetical protein
LSISVLGSRGEESAREIKNRRPILQRPAAVRVKTTDTS